MLGEVLTAVVTPFDERGAIDVARFRTLCRFLVESGSDGVVVAGTTGESPTLTDDERLTLIAAAVDEVGDAHTVVAGTGTYATAHSVHLTARAHELGADGFLVVTPYYNKPPPRGIVEHFKAVAAETDRPIVVYNIPARVVINIEPETIARLAEIPNVVAVKQAHDDLAQARRIVELGGIGGVCVHTHVVGPRVKEQVRRTRDGDVEAGRQLDAELSPAYDLLKVAPNPIAIKCALELLGHEVGGLRLPLVEATDAERESVRACLERLKLLEPATV